MIGYVVKFNGSLVTWKTKKQQVVALSTTEAELYSLSATLKEILWTKNFLESLGIRLERNLIYEDNQGTIELVKKGKKEGRTKHVDVKHHFIGNHIKNGNIEIKYLKTEQQLADMMTKALGRIKFEKFREELGVIKVNSVSKGSVGTFGDTDTNDTNDTNDNKAHETRVAKEQVKKGINRNSDNGKNGKGGTNRDL